MRLGYLLENFDDAIADITTMTCYDVLPHNLQVIYDKLLEKAESSRRSSEFYRFVKLLPPITLDMIKNSSSDSEIEIYCTIMLTTHDCNNTGELEDVLAKTYIMGELSVPTVADALKIFNYCAANRITIKLQKTNAKAFGIINNHVHSPNADLLQLQAELLDADLI